MPAKKHTISDEERARRIRELAREAKTDQSPKVFERAFTKVVPIIKNPSKKDN